MPDGFLVKQFCDLASPYDYFRMISILVHVFDRRRKNKVILFPSIERDNTKGGLDEGVS